MFHLETFQWKATSLKAAAGDDDLAKKRVRNEFELAVITGV